VGSLAPAGRMLPHDRVTVPVKPLVGVIVTVDVAEVPATTEAGERAVAAIAKSAVTVRLTVVSWLKDPKVPVAVTVEVAGGVAAVVVIVSTEVTAVTPGVTVGGLKAQLAPSGRPEQVSVTALLKPLTAATEMV
jgi:hypothetical protein